MLLTILILDKKQYTRITKQHKYKYKRKKIKNMNMKKTKKTIYYKKDSIISTTYFLELCKLRVHSVSYRSNLII